MPNGRSGIGYSSTARSTGRCPASPGADSEPCTGRLPAPRSRSCRAHTDQRSRSARRARPVERIERRAVQKPHRRTTIDADAIPVATHIGVGSCGRLSITTGASCGNPTTRASTSCWLWRSARRIQSASHTDRILAARRRAARLASGTARRQGRRPRTESGNRARPCHVPPARGRRHTPDNRGAGRELDRSVTGGMGRSIGRMRRALCDSVGSAKPGRITPITCGLLSSEDVSLPLHRLMTGPLPSVARPRPSRNRDGRPQGDPRGFSTQQTPISGSRLR